MGARVREKRNGRDCVRRKDWMQGGVMMDGELRALHTLNTQSADHVGLAQQLRMVEG